MEHGKLYRVVISGYFGINHIGLDGYTKEEAQKLADKYNEQNDNPWIHYQICEMR